MTRPVNWFGAREAGSRNDEGVTSGVSPSLMRTGGACHYRSVGTLPAITLLCCLWIAATPSAAEGLLPGEGRIRQTTQNPQDSVDPFGETNRRLLEAQIRAGRPGLFCDPDEGDVCVFVSPYLRFGPGTEGRPLQPDLDRYLREIMLILEDHPEHWLARGIAIMGARFWGEHASGAALVETCPTQEAPCDLFRAVWLYGSGRRLEAEAVYESVLEGLPRAEWELWSDLTWLGLDVEEYPAADRDRWRAQNDTIWWLADPLWTVEGNSRWLGHMDRLAVEAITEVLGNPETIPLSAIELSDGQLRTSLLRIRRRIRTGRIDAWNVAHGPRGEYWGRHYDFAMEAGYEYNNFWVSKAGARYSFLPSERLIRDPFLASSEDWDLEPDDPVERFTDPDWPTIVPLPHQVARFERDGASVVLGATEPPPDPAFDGASTHGAMVISAGPGDLRATVGTAADRTYRFVDTVPDLRHMLGIEVLSAEAGVAGRVRLGLTERASDGLRVSDVVLVRAPESTEATRTLEEVSSRMLGRSGVAPDEALDAYWEVHGLDPEELITYELRVRSRRTGGLLRRIVGWLGFGADPAETSIRWEEMAAPDNDGAVRQELGLDLSGLAPGFYSLEVIAIAESGEVASSDRPFEVRDAG